MLRLETWNMMDYYKHPKKLGKWRLICQNCGEQLSKRSLRIVRRKNWQLGSVREFCPKCEGNFKVGWLIEYFYEDPFYVDFLLENKEIFSDILQCFKCGEDIESLFDIGSWFWKKASRKLFYFIKNNPKAQIKVLCCNCERKHKILDVKMDLTLEDLFGRTEMDGFVLEGFDE